jgi:hypothetical protein
MNGAGHPAGSPLSSDAARELARRLFDLSDIVVAGTDEYDLDRHPSARRYSNALLYGDAARECPHGVLYAHRTVDHAPACAFCRAGRG